MEDRMARPSFLLLTLVVALSGCTQLPPERQLIADAAKALGGEDRIRAVKTLSLEGEGSNFNLGQDMRPEAAAQTFTVAGYRRVVDVASGRLKVEQTRTPNFAYFQGPQAQRQVAGIDGDVAYNVGANGTPARVAGQVVQERKTDYFHHPVTILRAALDPATNVSNLRTAGSERLIDVATGSGQTVTLAIDAAGLPVRTSSPSYNANLGDVTLTTTFADYQDVNGLKLPARITTKVDDFTTADLRLTKQALDGDIGDVTAPEAAASAPAPAPAAPAVTTEQIAPGVWFLGGQSHHSVLVEFADHLTLIEAPLSEARTLAVIAKARELKPGKPLTELVTTHHHFDHTAGLRAAISEGLTVITQAGNKAFVETMASRSHSRQPDALTRNAKPVTVETVDADRVLKDPTMEVDLYHVQGSPHSDTMLMAYIPKARALVEVDVFSPGAAVHPYAANLLENVTTRKLRVDRIIPLHGAIVPFAELTKTQAAANAN
jgi:glyoxylase-like metal-dependent hydrolase (beta-lactamase superfamily II)